MLGIIVLSALLLYVSIVPDALAMVMCGEAENVTEDPILKTV